MTAPPELETMGQAGRRRLAGAIRKVADRIARATAGGRWRVWAWYALIWGVAILAIVGLIVTLAGPSTEDLVEQAVDRRLEVDVDAFPRDQARELAARTVRDGLTVEAFGDDDVAQDVIEVLAGAVDVRTDELATVKVAALVTTSAGAPDPETGAVTAGESTWRWLEVPVSNSDGIVSLVAGPVDVPAPRTITVDPPTISQPDQDYTEETRDLVEVAFGAWAGESAAALDSVTDGSIDLLPEGIDYLELSTWAARPIRTGGVGGGAPRNVEGLATVRWESPSGITTEQTYSVLLERNGDDRWSVIEIGSAHLGRPEQQ